MEEVNEPIKPPREKGEKIAKNTGQKSEIERRMEQLSAALERQHNTASGVKREGKILTIPEYMNEADAIEVLQQRLKEAGEKQKKSIRIDGHPTDLLKNATDALIETFGHAFGGSMKIESFFGEMEVPGETRTLKTGYDTTVTVPYGNIVIPGLPIKLSFVFQDETKVPNTLLIGAEYRKQFQPLVEEIERQVRKKNKEQSVFKGKAINSRWEFINLNGFPMERIVYAEVERAALNANLFRVIQSPQAVKAAGIPLKRTILLHGKFGTGKTLTALKTANIAVKNGWTFLNVVPGDDIVVALTMALQYQPAVVFFEDIDHVTSGGRDEHLNKILNTADGLLSKSSEIVLILTTNSIQSIDRAMMRPGRIDREITLGRVDAQMLEGMIRGYVGKSLSGTLDIPALLEAAKDYTPAFIAEACSGAMLFALDRTAGKSTEITNQDLLFSLKALRSQYELMTREMNSKPSLEAQLQMLVYNAVEPAFSNIKMKFAKELLGTLPESVSAFKSDWLKKVEKELK